MPLGFPDLVPAKVRLSRIHAQQVARFAFNYQDFARDNGARRWRIAVTPQVADVVDAAIMNAFFEALDGTRHTFTMDLDPHAAGVSPAPGVVEFRLDENPHALDVRLRVTWEFSFTATEVAEGES